MIDKELQEQLREKYNPDGSKLRMAQLRMLELLKFLDRICKENNIQYWLDSGTLLGAARHGGFIPWDDDVDVCMTREDAKKLKKIMGANIFDSHIVLQTKDNDPNYLNSSWMTLRDMKLEYVQNSPVHNRLKYKGVQVDIFMVESGIPGSIKRFTSRLQWYLVNKPFYSSGVLRFLKPFSNLIHRTLEYFVYPLCRLLKGDREIYNYGIGNIFNKRHHYTTIFPLRKIGFEGIDLNCPQNSDKYLRNLYGNWELMPDSGSIKTHNVEFREIN